MPLEEIDSSFSFYLFPCWLSTCIWCFHSGILFLSFLSFFFFSSSCRHHSRHAVFFKQGFSPRTPRQKTPLVQRWESGLINGREDDEDWRRKEEVGPEWPREGESEAGKRARTEGREAVWEGFSQEKGKNPSPISELVHLASLQLTTVK